MRLFLYTLVLATLLWGGLEFCLRHPIFQRRLPPQTFVAAYPPLNLKYDALNRYVDEHGRLDCLLVGSSITLNGINTDQLSAAYQAETGQPLACFNFGLPAVHMHILPWLLPDLVSTYHPRLVIWGITAIDLDDGMLPSLAPLWNSPWLRYQRHELTLRGGLSTYSHTARYFETLRLAWFAPPDATSFEIFTRYTASGYEPLVTYNRDPFAPPVPAIQLEVVLSPDLATELAELKQKLAVPILFLQIPILDSAMPVLYNQQVLPHQEAFEVLTRSLGDIPVWRTDHLTFFTSLDWMNYLHFHLIGSTKFGDWLGRELATTHLFEQLPQIPPMKDIPDPQIEPVLATMLDSTAAVYQSWQQLNSSKLLPPTATVFDPALPNPSHDEYLTLLGLFLHWKYTPQTIPSALFELWAVLEKVQFEAELDLDATQTATLAQWRMTKQAQLLAETGIEYLLVSSEWLKYLSEAERQVFTTDAGYQLLKSWSYPAQTNKSFYLYQILEDGDEQ